MPIRVYLADGNAAVREGLRFLLEAQKDLVVVGETADGPRVVREILRVQPDVVIMDIASLGLNGIEVTRQIHQVSPSIQMVLLSICTTKEHILRSLRAGAKGYLLKESAGQEVVEAVRAVHAGHSFLSHGIRDIGLNHRPEEHPNDP